MLASTTERAAPRTPLPLRVNFSWTIIGNAAYAVCQWGMLVTLVKHGQPGMVGQFALALAIAAPVTLCCNLQLRAIQATDSGNEYVPGDYIGLRLVTTLLALLTIAGIAVFSNYRWETSLVVLAVGGAKAFESISDVLYGLLQRYELMDKIAKSFIIKGVLSLAMLFAAIELTGSMVVGALALGAVGALTLAAYDIPVVVRMWRVMHPPDERATASGWKGTALWPRWEPRKMLRLTWLSLPLGFALMFISLSTNVPRYAIQAYLGESELGVFAALAYGVVAGNMLVTALGQSATPRLARYHAAGDRAAFRRLSLSLIGLATLLGGSGILVAAIAGPAILRIVYGPEYASYGQLLVWLMVSGALGYVASFLGFLMTAARRFKVQLPLFAIATAAGAGACYALVPRYGLIGAALGLVCSTSVQAIGSAIILSRARPTVAPGPDLSGVSGAVAAGAPVGAPVVARYEVPGRRR